MKKCFMLLAVVVMTMFMVVGCSKGITEDEAKAIAVDMIDGFDVEDIASCELNGQKYEIRIPSENVEFTICIAKADGSLLLIESETLTAGNQPADGVVPMDMGKEAIKKIALEKVPGAKEADVFYCMYIDVDVDKPLYDVMIMNGEKANVFEIDASTGEILSQDEVDLNEVDINH